MLNQSTNVTAAMLAIGDELLSGRTKDKNIGYLADELTEHGIDLCQVRIVPDDESEIIAAVHALCERYDYVFTSGGIGPTHDDITAESISKAFNKACIFDTRAEEILKEYYTKQNQKLTPARRLMTRMPKDSEIIQNSVSGAPGFKISNCFVMAGVPRVFQAMLAEILPKLRKSAPIHTTSIKCEFPESYISKKLGEIQKRFPNTSIGSYPHAATNSTKGAMVEILIRGRDDSEIQNAADHVRNMLKQLQKNNT